MSDAGALDRNDPLARFRDEFVHEEGGPLYVDGNSLGRLPKRTQAALAEVVERWGADLVRGWHEWIELPTEVGDELAEHALGARPGEVVVTDSVTVNLYKLASAVLAARPDKRVVVTDLDNFPTDRYVLEGVADDLRFIEPDPIEGPTVADVEAACAAGDVGLVALSHVAYRPGALADLEGITEAAHAAGALVVWDLSHSVGAVEVGLEEHGVDLAVGCTYKYLNAGPGAPAFLYVRESRSRRSSARPSRAGSASATSSPWATPTSRPTAWRASSRAPRRSWGSSRSAQGWRSSPRPASRRSPPRAVPSPSTPSSSTTSSSAPLGVELGTPRDPARRGAHLSFRHPEAWRICRALIERADVIPDYRGPDSVRFGFPPLYTRFADVREAIERLRRVIEREEYLEVDPAFTRVT